MAFTPRSLWQWLRFLISLCPVQYITVEPVIIAYSLAFSLSLPIYSELLRDRLCRQVLQYGEQVCASLNDAQYHVQAEKVRGSWAVWNGVGLVVSVVPAAVVQIYLSTWSDRYGRRVPLALPHAGTVLASLVLIANSLIPSMPFWTILFAPFISGATGGFLIVLTAVMSYEADLSPDPKSAARTIRIAVADIGTTLGFGLGNLVGAELVSRYSYAVSFYVYAATGVFGCLYVWLRVVETIVADEESTWGVKLRALISNRNAIDLWETLTKRRDNSNRTVILLTFAGFFVFQWVMIGEMPVYQPFLEFKPIGWSLSFYMFIMSMANFFMVPFYLAFFPLVSGVLHWRDSSVAILGCLSKQLNSGLLFVAKTSMLVYVSFGFGVLRVASVIAVRAVLSRAVGGHEQARIFAVVALIENITASLGGLSFGLIFKATAAYAPSLIFLFSTLALFFPLVIYTIVHVIIVRRDRRVGVRNESMIGDGSAVL